MVYVIFVYKLGGEMVGYYMFIDMLVGCIWDGY